MFFVWNALDGDTMHSIESELFICVYTLNNKNCALQYYTLLTEELFFRIFYYKQTQAILFDILS